jgi:starch synthase
MDKMKIEISYLLFANGIGFKEYWTMTVEHSVPFSVYYVDDAYSTKHKMMGRQSTGKSFMRGLARFCPQSQISGVGLNNHGGKAMYSQLRESGFQGQVRWRLIEDVYRSSDIGTIYYPAPPIADLVHIRNRYDPTSLSIMGVTHTLSSLGTFDQLSALCLPPFTPWDALICTSHAAKTLVEKIHEQTQNWWREQTGANRFHPVQLPVIPLGVNVDDFAPNPDRKMAARQAFGLKDDEVVCLFSGRLSFHAKANPIPMYHVLEKIAAHQKVVLIEAGIYISEQVRDAMEKARQVYAPSIRFIWADGRSSAYEQSWQAADIFVSLSDNIQETFGITPVEAMAAGLPVLVSDWNGYKDTIRDGVDGFRIPTIMAQGTSSKTLMDRYGLTIDSYDYFIGKMSLMTMVDHNALYERMNALIMNRELRLQMGQAALKRAQNEYDWCHIFPRYNALAEELSAIRASYRTMNSPLTRPSSYPSRLDPGSLFEHFATRILGHEELIIVPDNIEERFERLRNNALANFGTHGAFINVDLAERMVRHLQDQTHEGHSVNVGQLIHDPLWAPHLPSHCLNNLCWLLKFEVCQLA